MSKLRLGPLIDEKPVKLSIDVPGPLIRELTDYARVHAAANGLTEPLPPERLIVPMVERFMAGDREFSKMRRRS